MSLHDANIRSRLSRFLDRKQMPRRLEGKPTAMEDEIRALCAAVSRNAPRSTDNLANWWVLFEARLGEVCGNYWPSEKEIKAAGRSAMQEAPRPQIAADSEDQSPVAINARRMKNGDPVGEGWLYGRNAVELIASGLIDRETMERYRKGAFMARKQAHGEDKALDWQRQAQDRHEGARVVYHHRNDAPYRHDLSVPDKRAVPAEGFS